MEYLKKIKLALSGNCQPTVDGAPDMSFAVGDEPADDLPVNDFVHALADRCNLARAAALRRWKEQLDQHDIQSVQELKMVMAPVARQMFVDADVGEGAQAMVRLALAPQSPTGWSWPNATRQGNSVKSGEGNAKVAPTWDTSAKYTRANYKGNINEFVFPDGVFDEWPPCDVLPYKDMLCVGNRVWALINTHPELKGGGLTVATLKRIAAVLGTRYKSLEPVGKNESRNSQRANKLEKEDSRCEGYHLARTASQVFCVDTSPQVLVCRKIRPRTWETFLTNRFKNARQVTYKNMGMSKDDVMQLDPCVQNKVCPPPFLQLTHLFYEPCSRRW